MCIHVLLTIANIPRYVLSPMFNAVFKLFKALHERMNNFNDFKVCLKLCLLENERKR